MFVFGLLALLSYEVAEISINSYFINFVTGMKWMDDRTASVALTCALAFFMVGRFLGLDYAPYQGNNDVAHLCCGQCCLYRFGALRSGYRVAGSPARQLYFRGHHVPYHLQHRPHGIGQSYQVSIFASDDDSDRRMRLPADGNDSRYHSCHPAFRGTVYRFCHRLGLCSS